MNRIEFQIKKGVIVAYNSVTYWGRIKILRGGKKIKFHSTCFQSTLPTRFPKLGETVQIIFSCGKLVSVRSV